MTGNATFLPLGEALALAAPVRLRRVVSGLLTKPERCRVWLYEGLSDECRLKRIEDMTFELIGAPEQINTTPGPLAFEGLATQSGGISWAFYLPVSSDNTASGLTGDLIAREINASGVPTGSEIDLPVPAAQTGYAIGGADGAVLADGSFIVSYVQLTTNTPTPSFLSDVVHYSATGTVLGSFLVDTAASPEALSTGGFSLSEAGFGGAPNAVIATYAETATTPSSSTTVATAAAGQEIVARACRQRQALSAKWRPSPNFGPNLKRRSYLARRDDAIGVLRSRRQ